MSRAIDDLRHEHDAILAALGILQNMDQQLSTGRSASPARPDADLGADLQAFMGFLQEFADQCHHGKEEGLLFPALTAVGVAAPGVSVDDLLKEHEQGREKIRQMQASLQPTLDAAQFSSAARGYADVLRSHIQKENDVLFPLAEKALSPQKLDELFDAFEAHEENVIGAGRHEQLHTLLKGLHKKYRAPA